MNSVPAQGALSERYLPDDWTLPLLNEHNRPFFTMGQLVLQRCESCGQVQHPPLDLCRHCQGQHLDQVTASGRGRISSYTVVHRSADPRLDDHVPYNVVIVELDDHPGVMVVGNVINQPEGPWHIGAAVVCTFAPVTDPGTGEALQLPQWRLVQSTEGAEDHGSA